MTTPRYVPVRPDLGAVLPSVAAVRRTTYVPIRTESDLRSHVKLGSTVESVLLEFKGDLHGYKSKKPDERREGQKEFCRDVAQFANTFGGCILFGVSEVNVNGVPVADRLSPLDDFDRRRQWMEQATANYLVPSTLRIEIESLRLPEGLLISVNVDPSERLVTLWDRQSGTIECLRRRNHGKAYMNPDEMEAQMSNTARSSMLALRRIRQESQTDLVHLASGAWLHRRAVSHDELLLERVSSKARLGVLSEYDFELHVHLEGGLHVVRVPYGLVREAWLTSDLWIGLFLHVRLIVSSDGLTMEPF